MQRWEFSFGQVSFGRFVTWLRGHLVRFHSVILLLGHLISRTRLAAGRPNSRHKRPSDHMTKSPSDPIIKYYPRRGTAGRGSGDWSSNSCIVFPDTGCRKSNAISAMGAKTKFRSCKYGCGKVSALDCRISCS